MCGGLVLWRCGGSVFVHHPCHNARIYVYVQRRDVGIEFGGTSDVLVFEGTDGLRRLFGGFEGCCT